MTNEEAIKAIKELNHRCGICGLSQSVVCNEAKDIAINSLEENTKLKAEINELKEEVNANKLWADVLERTLKKEIDKNAKLCEEIAELKKFASIMLEKEYSGCDLLQGNNSCMDCYRFDICLDALKEEQSK